MAYKVEGTLLEVCTCEILCPCWVGEDPDNPTCDSIMAYHVDSGQVNGTDLSGRTLALITDIPGNVMKGNWKAAVFVDDGAEHEQHPAMVDIWTGELGGSVAAPAQLVGQRSREPLNLIVAGTTADVWLYGALQERAQALGIAERTYYLGAVPNLCLPDPYRSAVAFVLPPPLEIFAHPLVEAMALGAPVVASGLRGCCFILSIPTMP